MELKQLIRLDLDNDKVYILEAAQDKLIVNDAYNGILILNDALTLIKDIPLLDDLRIRWIYKRVTQDALLLYCYENKVLIYVDLHTFSNTIIPLPDGYRGQLFSPLYYWHHDDIILSTNNKLHRVNVIDATIVEIAETDIEEDHLEFYKIWTHYKEQEVIFYDPADYSLIIKEKDSVTFEHFDLIRKRRITKEIPVVGSLQDALHHKGRIVLVYEQQLVIREVEDKLEVKLTMQAPYVFKSVRFLDDSYKKLAALLNDTSRVKHSLLKIYEIEENK